MIIIGIDPGVALVGYGVIKTDIAKNLKQDISKKPIVIDFGCVVTTNAYSVGERLEKIYN